MSHTSVGIYEFNAKDLIGHGAFAVVYKGRLKTVSTNDIFIYLLSEICAIYCNIQSELSNFRVKS